MCARRAFAFGFFLVASRSFRNGSFPFYYSRYYRAGCLFNQGQLLTQDKMKKSLLGAHYGCKPITLLKMRFTRHKNGVSSVSSLHRGSSSLQPRAYQHILPKLSLFDRSVYQSCSLPTGVAYFLRVYSSRLILSFP